MADNISYCTFWLDGLRFGIEVLEVQEVLRIQSMTPVPLAPRGDRRADQPPRPDHHGDRPPRAAGTAAPDPSGERSVNIVVRTEEGPVSMIVDQIGGVLEVDRASFELPPETLSGAGRDLIAGVYKVDGPLLHVLEVARVIGELVSATRKGDA